MSDFDRQQYLDHCSRSEMISLEALTYWGIIAILVMAGLDLVLTMTKINHGPFRDANPLAQIFISNGVAWGLIIFKIGAASFFSWVCLKNLELLTTQIGVGFAVMAHFLLTFHWVLLF